MTLPKNPIREVLRPEARQRLKDLLACGILTPRLCFHLMGLLEPLVTHCAGPADCKVPDEDTLDGMVHELFPGTGPQCGDLKEDFALVWWDIGKERIRLAARPRKNTLTAWVEGKPDTKRQFTLTPDTLLANLVGWLGIARVAIPQRRPVFRGMVTAISGVEGPTDPLLDE